jgi:small-conductance mechanosensitive channel
MNSKLMALSVLALLALGLLSPMIPEGADALDTTDYGISIPGYNPEEEILISLGNGESKSFSVYVVNKSDMYLDVTFSAESESKDVKIEDIPSNGLLVPENEVDHDNIASGVFKISARELSESHDSIPVTLTIAITDINDKTSTQYVDVYFDIKVESIYDTSGSYNKVLGIFENNLPAPFNSVWVPFIVTIIFWMVIAEAATIVIAPRLAKRLDRLTTDDDALRFERSISGLIAVLVFVLSVNQGLAIIGANAEIVSDFLKISTIVYIAITLVILWKVYLITMEGILSKFEDKDDTSIDMTLMPLFRMLGKIVFWIAGASLILGSVGVDLQGILISAGVVSLGITMGAQNVLSQFFSGIVILMTRPFKKGDFLKINGNVYIVRKVKIMFTEFYSWDKDQIISMPNNSVTASTIINLTKEDEAYRLYIYFEVAYGTDLKKAERVMLDVAEKSPIVLHDSEHAAPNVRLTDFQDSGLQLRLGVTIRNFNGSITDASTLRMEVYQAYLDNDIEVPYDRLEVTMLNDCFQGERRPGDNVPD